MTQGWGIGPWGTGGGGWGLLNEADAGDGPTVTTVATEDAPPGLATFNPAPVDVRGGTILRILGADFIDPQVEVLYGSAPSYDVAGECIGYDARYDVSGTRIFVGTPALVAGLYHLRVTTAAGSTVIESALAARPFAHEFKTVSVRGKYAPVWKTGERLLRGG